MFYTLHQLQILVKVAEHQSITKAADDLNLSQPAISIQLKNLQAQFELPLTEVIGRQLYVTDFGKQIVASSQRILQEADTIKYTVDQYKGMLTGSIKISVVSTGKYVMPYFLKPFMEKYPGVDIMLDVSNKNMVVEAMRQNECDFSLVSLVPEEMRVEKLELMENRLYLAGNADFSTRVQYPSDLKKLTLLFREEGSATRKAMIDYLNKNDIKPAKSMTLVSNEAIKQAINAGLGFSIVPLIGLRTALESENIRLYPVKGLPIITKWHLIYNRNKQLTPAQKEFVNYINLHKEEVVKEHFNWALQEKP